MYLLDTRAIRLSVISGGLYVYASVLSTTLSRSSYII